jgi:hypothetical protein
MSGRSGPPPKPSRSSAPGLQAQHRIRRIAALRGKHKHSLSSSDDFAARKTEVIELESHNGKTGG